MAPTPVTTLEFQLTQREFARGLRHLARRNRSLVILAAVAALLIAIAIAIGNAVIAIAGSALLLSLAWTWFAVPRQQWRRKPAAVRRPAVHVRKDRILMLTSTTRAELEWGYFAEVVEADDLYVLLGANKLCNILPQRAFASATDDAQFRDLVCARRDAGTLKSAITG